MSLTKQRLSTSRMTGGIPYDIQSQITGNVMKGNIILLLHCVPHSIGGAIVATVKRKLRPLRVSPCCFAVS